MIALISKHFNISISHNNHLENKEPFLSLGRMDPGQVDKVKEQYKDKLNDIITLLQKNNINYGNLENILLCNNSFLFHQYDKVSSLKDSNSDKETMKKWFK